MLTIAIAVLTLVTVGGLAYALMGERLTGGGAAVKRAQAVAGGHATGRGRAKGADNPALAAQQRRKQVQQTIKDLEEKQKERRKKQVPLRVKLARAGLAMEPKVFVAIFAALGLGGAGAAYAALGGNLLVAGLVGFSVGFGAPNWVIGMLIAKRQKQFLEEFGNALDVVVRGVKAGLPVVECLKMVGRESPGPVGEEFTRLVEGQRLGVTLEQGLHRLYERMPIAEVNFFVIVMALQQKTGGNLSEALGNLSNVLRDRKIMRGKIQAMSSEAKASAMIIGSLPPGVGIMLALVSPDYVSLLWTDERGHLLLIGSALCMATGVFVMRQMINFKF